MSEQGTEPDTPAVAGPEGPGTAEQGQQAEIDWQKRYVDLQPEYTRATQEAAELRRQQELYDLLLSTDDADTRRQAAAELGYVLDEEEQSPDPDEDPYVAVDERLGRVEQTLSAQEQREADEAYAAQVRQAVDAELDTLSLDKADQDWVLAYAINALPITEEGLPDIRQAYDVFAARETQRQRDWAKSKRAPHISPNGQAATEAPNLDNRQERQDFIMRRMLESEEAQY